MAAVNDGFVGGLRSKSGHDAMTTLAAIRAAEAKMTATAARMQHNCVDEATQWDDGTPVSMARDRVGGCLAGSLVVCRRSCGGVGRFVSAAWALLAIVEVLLHGLAGVDGVVGADGAVDLAVHLGGLLEVLGVLDGLAAVVVEVGGDGLHEGAEDGVAGGSGDGAVEADVVDEVLLGVVEGGVHLGDLFGELGDVLVGGALGGEGGDVGLR